MTSRKKRTLFVGGLDGGQVTDELLQAAFIPFGDIKSVSIPKDFAGNPKEDKSSSSSSSSSSLVVASSGSSSSSSGSSGGGGQAMGRGYGFVEFEEEEDALAAMDNMNGAEFFGRILNVYYARPMKTNTTKAVWEDGITGRQGPEGGEGDRGSEEEGR